MLNDKGLKRELDQAGLPSAGNQPFILPGQETRDLGIPCADCGSRKVVYFIAAPDHAGYFPTGAYCYADLLKRCRAARMIPMPMPLELLESLKRDLALTGREKKIFIDMGGKQNESNLHLPGML